MTEILYAMLVVAAFVYAVYLLVTKSRDKVRPSNTPTASTRSSRGAKSRLSDNSTPYNYGLYSGSSPNNTSSRSCGYDSSSSSSSDSGSSCSGGD